MTTTVSGTGILLPLYVYPSSDGSSWQPAFDAMSAYPDISWLTVIDPWDGPGSLTSPGNANIDYISGTAKLNSHNNVQTIGYVHTSYATADMGTLQANITGWKNWDAYTASKIGVKGIFFDESADNITYMSEAVSFAKSTFGDNVVTICNFGAKAPAEYYDLCSVVIAFESALNTSPYPPYLDQDQATITNNIPAGKASDAAILVNTFTGTAQDTSIANSALLGKYQSTLVSNNIGWSYFCSAGYNSITTGPATIMENAATLAVALA